MDFAIPEKSPFLLRDLLLAEAAQSERDDLTLLDASRGAANWQLRRVLNAWHALGLFATEAAEIAPGDGEVALALDPDIDWAQRFADFAARDWTGAPGIARGCEFLARAWAHLDNELLPGWGLGRVIYEFAEAVAGRRYAAPPTLEFVAPVMTAYLAPLLFGGDTELARQFHVIACEGATTGIVQATTTLARNRLLTPGDRVAMWWPTYEPLRDLVECQLGCEVVPVARDPDRDWALVTGEEAKLLDPRVRLVITVSPGNPVPVVTDRTGLEALGTAVEARPDLLVLADYVYTHFLDAPVETEIGRLPHNTIGVYSVSKDFGLAGMRLGVVLIHPHGAAEQALRGLTPPRREQADAPYRRRALDPERMTLEERIIADSRGVSFMHMSGLSTPLQALMCLCALYDLTDPEAPKYFEWVRTELAARVEALYAGLGLPLPAWALGPTSRYSTVIDLRAVARARGGAELERALTGQSLWPLLETLARDWKVILTPAEGFGAGAWSVRACFPAIDVGQARELGERIGNAVEQLGKRGR